MQSQISRFGKANDRLSRAVSEVLRVVRDYNDPDTVAANEAFDGGEFSGPAMWRQMVDEVVAVAERHGFRATEDFTPAEVLVAAVEARTSARWVHFNLPGDIVGDEQ